APPPRRPRCCPACRRSGRWATQLSQKEAQLQDLEHQLAGLKGTAEKYRQLKQQESEVVGLELAELRREQAGYEQQIQAVAEAKQAVQEQIDNMASTVAQNKEAVRKARRSSPCRRRSS
ncbi:hypothetical protein CRUP_008309, partial [Coryphaenoides rupestris]